MKPSLDEQERSQEIARLTRTYAQNRSLGVVIGLLVFSVQYAAISLLSYFGGVAYRDGNQLLFWTCMAALVPVLAALVYMSVPKWGGRRLEALVCRLYPEGSVSISVPNQQRRQRIAMVTAVVFGCCVLASVLLGFYEIIPPKYAQPVSALYFVPFLVGLKLLMHPAVSYVSLLWPMLYGLHAIMIVAGAPIVFIGRWESMNTALPVIGYGLITALVGHAYNRHALHTLRQTTQINDTYPGKTKGASQR
jgi:hypothetical protein